MDGRCRREVSIGAPIPHLLVVVTSIRFRAVAKTICRIPEKVAGVAVTVSFQVGK